MRSNQFVFPSAVLCLLMAHGACSGGFIVDLGPASGPFKNGDGTTVSGVPLGHLLEQFTVSLTFDPTGTPYAGQKLAFVAIDVSASSPALSASSNGYTVFSFDPDPTNFPAAVAGVSPGWKESPVFGNASNPGENDLVYVATVGKKTDLSKLLAGSTTPYTVGTLTLDLTAAGVTADPTLFVGLAASDLVHFKGTVIGVSPSTSLSITQVAVTFNRQQENLASAGGGGGGPPVVPTPSSLALFAVAGVLAWVIRRRLGFGGTRRGGMRAPGGAS